MAAPDARLMVGKCDILLLGTIPGFVPDGERVQQAAKEHAPDCIALGVPESDLESMEALIADPTLADGLDTDELDLHFLEQIAVWGTTQFIPSPDLHAAHQTGRPLRGIDLSDDEHTQRFTDTVKVRHLVRRSAVRKRLMHTTADDAPDAYALAKRWDNALCEIEPLRALEQEREQHMCNALQELSKQHQKLLVVVHTARLDGMLTCLRNGP